MNGTETPKTDSAGLTNDIEAPPPVVVEPGGEQPPADGHAGGRRARAVVTSKSVGSPSCQPAKGNTGGRSGRKPWVRRARWSAL